MKLPEIDSVAANEIYSGKYLVLFELCSGQLKDGIKERILVRI